MNLESRNLIQAIRGPVILITVGVLFAVDNMTEIRFRQTWPVLLIVLGLLSLAGGRRRDRNRDRDRNQNQNSAQPPASPGVSPEVSPGVNE